MGGPRRANRAGWAQATASIVYRLAVKAGDLDPVTKVAEWQLP
jgi:hypothetical protein